MPQDLYLLAATAATVGFIHTVAGPDHYLPFIVMAKARNWSTTKTTWITILCGLGHIGSSVILGLLGVALGIAVSKLEGLESIRGNIAGWALIAFGLIYLVWGARRAIRNRPHSHLHLHRDGSAHLHKHVHHEDHAHVHDEQGRVNITPWVLFTIFVLGPCEPLIPIVMYPAAQHSTVGLITVTAVFGFVTIATMLGIVLATSFGMKLLPMGKLERYSHALAGGSILMCGLAIQFMGL
ncbi:MAG: sulfite exporter TauE/SafE family protein [Candidatus Zixiibacteriota bacterium]